MANQTLFNEIAKKIAVKEGITTPKLNFQYTSEKGEGYMGEINALKLEGDDNRSLDLIFKTSPMDEKVREALSSRAAFMQEIKFYEEVLTSFESFQKDYKVDQPFNNVPKCYITHSEPNQELLVLENLKTLGFELHEKLKSFNKAHLEYTLKTMAKFQGTCMALKIKRPKEFEKLKNSLCGNRKRDFFDEVIEKTGYHRALPKIANNLMDIFDPITEKEYFNKYKDFVQNCVKYMQEVYTYHDDEVFGQGDCWCNNLMFKYASENDHSKPIEMKIIDFQFVFLRSALMEIAYFFYSSAPQEEFNNLNYYLKYYHDSLAAHLFKLGCNVGEVFPFDRLMQTWPKYAKYGFCMALFVRKALLGDSSDVPDSFAVPGDLFGAFVAKSSREEEYRQQMKVLATHFIDRGFM